MKMFRQLYTQTGLKYFHSTDLSDMQRAIVEEDDDGPDGGSPHLGSNGTRVQGSRETPFDGKGR